MIAWESGGAGVRLRAEIRARALFKDGVSGDGWIFVGAVTPL
jgi:hypothetical protein